MLGISTPHGEGVAQLAFFGLFALQHRGQEAAGIAVSDGAAGAGAQAGRPRVERVHERDAGAAHRLPRHRPHPLLDDRVVSNERNIQPFLVETMHGPLALAHNGNIVNTPALRDELLGRGLRAHRDERLRGDDADARRRRRPDVGGAHRAHAAGVEGRVLARRCWPPTGCSPCATRGASGRCRSGACPTAATPWPARRARCRRSAASRSARSSRARSSRCRAPSCTAARRSPPAPSPGPLHVRVRLLLPARLACGTAATSTTSASGSAPSWPRESPGRRRRRHPGAGLLDPRRHRVRPGQRRAVQRRADQEPLHRPHVHRADAGDPRPRRGAEVQRAVREPRRPAGRDDRRLARARHHRRAARQAGPRRRARPRCTCASRARRSCTRATSASTWATTAT